MENFILTIAFLLIGMGLRRLPRFPRDTAQVLNLFVIHVSLPALILLKVPQLTFSRNILAPVIMPWAMLAASAVIILFIARLRHWRREIIGALLLLVPLGNTSFLGIPMVQAFFGEAGIPYAVLYDQLGSFLALATYGTVILALYGSGERPRLALIVKKVITFPPFSGPGPGPGRSRGRITGPGNRPAQQPGRNPGAGGHDRGRLPTHPAAPTRGAVTPDGRALGQADRGPAPGLALLPSPGAQQPGNPCRHL